MTIQHLQTKRASVATPAGKIAYAEQGEGPVALFVHGVLLNGHLWRHQLRELAAMRRCIAVDLLGHGATEAAANQDVSSAAQADMLLQFLDALKLDKVDLIGNDSGGGIALIFAAKHPDRVRTLVLTDCDAHDNWPPEAFKPFLAMAAAGGLRDALGGMLSDKNVYRSPGALGPAYQWPAKVSDDTIETYLRPFLASPKKLDELRRFLASFDCRQTVEIEDRLRAFQAPTLIVWGTDDVYFPIKWARWLADTIPGTKRSVELGGARLFFPEERASELNAELAAFWKAHSA